MFFFVWLFKFLVLDLEECSLCERLRFEAVDCRLGSWSCVIVIIFLVWVSCLKENQWL
jgi:hypothetical protein